MKLKGLVGTAQNLTQAEQGSFSKLLCNAQVTYDGDDKRVGESYEGLSRYLIATLEIIPGSIVGSLLSLAAQIEYGGGGYQGAVSLVDFQNGISINIPGSWVRIKALAIGIGTYSVTVGAHASIGALPLVDPPIFSTGFGSVLTGVTETIGVSPHATAFKVLTGNIAAQDVSIEFKNILGTVLYDYQLQGGLLMPYVPLIGQVTEIDITNNGPAMEIQGVSSVAL